MTPSQVISALQTLTSIHQPVFLWGAPGVGKSQIVSQVAAMRGMALRDIRAVLLDPVDLRGLPRLTDEQNHCVRTHKKYSQQNNQLAYLRKQSHHLAV